MHISVHIQMHLRFPTPMSISINKCGSISYIYIDSHPNAQVCDVLRVRNKGVARRASVVALEQWVAEVQYRARETGGRRGLRLDLAGQEISFWSFVCTHSLIISVHERGKEGERERGREGERKSNGVLRAQNNIINNNNNNNNNIQVTHPAVVAFSS